MGCSESEGQLARTVVKLFLALKLQKNGLVHSSTLIAHPYRIDSLDWIVLLVPPGPLGSRWSAMLRSALPFVFQFPHRKPPPIRPRPPPVRRYASPPAAAGSVPPPLPPSSAYVHLPFCRKRCHYCDFPIVALGSSSPSPRGEAEDPRIADYVRLLLREVAATRAVSDDGVPLETIFFGGGTPSLVPPRLVAAVLDALRGKFGLSACPEVSIEMDPGTFDAAKLRELVGVGVNRVSLGVQAFQEDLLRACGRAHGLAEVREAVGIVTGCEGLQNWSMDLISSLPNQTEEMWEESLRCTIDARPTHVSVYDLQIEQGTKFGQIFNTRVFSKLRYFLCIK
ncbi:hypothetical protein BRADI_4g39227v3 [Brachypodium distachyon]|uniref:Radical SAM core domain-containing protein n=1 Tax=Brachypodium distachyon TaxID=15368 RepID=A0A2K2CT90_BRADI|nr:hypothetical protein BRADI_4g39227v3 [Brachypodium distachyon]PNT65241.1 hypothetical protein BRADI_4g39227v3 [Brachypodium distachyon]